jgi:hypothetical protein
MVERFYAFLCLGLIVWLALETAAPVPPNSLLP